MQKGQRSSEILKRTAKKYQVPVLWAWLEFFPPLRSTNSYITHYFLSFFCLNTLKATANTPIEGEQPDIPKPPFNP